MYRFLIFVLFILFGCTKPVHKSVNLELTIPKFKSTISISDDGLTATIVSNRGLSDLDSLMGLAQQPLSTTDLLQLASPEIHDSTLSIFSEIVSPSLSVNQRQRTFKSIQEKDGRYLITFVLDTNFVFPIIRNAVASHDPGQPIHHLFDRDGAIPQFATMIPSSPLQLPCKNLDIPTRASRLPNAPRAYRSGIHRGIDFFSNWGTPVRAVADGIIIRSDLNYEQYGADFRVEMLKRAAQLDRTPSDIFNELLLGQAVIIDHGFDLFPGYRTITIYAHLSHIHPDLKPGYAIQSGEVFGKTGNSGTEPSTIGTRAESHLHWELILQDSRGEYYFGQDLQYDDLQSALRRLFSH